jgi:hypothetical protein
VDRVKKISSVLTSSLAAGFLLWIFVPGNAAAYSRPSTPPALRKVSTIERIYPDSYASELRRAHPSWNRLRKVARLRWLRSHKNTKVYSYHLWRTRGPAAAVENEFRRLRVSSWLRRVYRCIARNEGHGMADVWNGFSRGWQGGRFAGTDRVNGWFQIRPYWTPTGSRVVTHETYLYTSDVVWSTDKAVEIGLDPFFAQRGRCF